MLACNMHFLLAVLNSRQYKRWVSLCAATPNRCQPACATLWRGCSSRRGASPPRKLSRCWQPWRGRADCRARPGPDHATPAVSPSQFTWTCCCHVNCDTTLLWEDQSASISQHQCDKMNSKLPHYLTGAFKHSSQSLCSDWIRLSCHHMTGAPYWDQLVVLRRCSSHHSL